MRIGAWTLVVIERKGRRSGGKRRRHLGPAYQSEEVVARAVEGAGLSGGRSGPSGVWTAYWAVAEERERAGGLGWIPGFFPFSFLFRIQLKLI